MKRRMLCSLLITASTAAPARATPEALGQLIEYEQNLRKQGPDDAPAQPAAHPRTPHAFSARSARHSSGATHKTAVPAAGGDSESRGFNRGYYWASAPKRALIRAGDQLGAGIFFPPILITALAIMFVLSVGAIVAGAVTAVID